VRGFLPAAVVVALVAVAPVVAAGGGGGGGPNGGWGGGLLSESLLFDCDETALSTGFMKWSPDFANLVFDFHGYELEEDMIYHLICFEGDESTEPAEFTELGARITCVVLVCYGVHIKGEVPWPGLTDATVCLVPDSCELFGGGVEWNSDMYLVSVGTADL